MYKIVLLEKEKVLISKELEDYDSTFIYVENLIKKLDKNRRIVVYEKRNENWIKFGEWKLE